MQYVEKMRAIKLELAADYLLMSAMLIEIKSRMLLPKPVEIEEEEDPRAELVRRLMEYEAIKLAAQRLDEMPQVGQDILVARACYEQVLEVQPPMVSTDELLAAWKSVLERASKYTHRSEEHTSELQSLMRISYAVFFLKNKINKSSKVHIIDQDRM